MEVKKAGFRKILPAAALALLTGIRFYLGIKTPVYLQADAAMDDFLYIQYAAHILEGKWLGDFSSLVLLKTASPAVLLAVNYVLGISYPVFFGNWLYSGSVLVFLGNVPPDGEQEAWHGIVCIPAVFPGDVP